LIHGLTIQGIRQHFAECNYTESLMWAKTFLGLDHR
jgi:hypothetical protein